MRDAKRQWDALVAGSGIDPLVAGGARRIVELMLMWYVEVRADDVVPYPDGDMLLFQWGTSDWGDGPSFGVNITRQLIDEYDEDDDGAIWQLGTTLHFPPSPTASVLGSGNSWCDGLQSVSSFHEFIKTSPVIAFGDVNEASRVEVNFEQAG